MIQYAFYSKFWKYGFALKRMMVWWLLVLNLWYMEVDVMRWWCRYSQPSICFRTHQTFERDDRILSMDFLFSQNSPDLLSVHFWMKNESSNSFQEYNLLFWKIASFETSRHPDLWSLTRAEPGDSWDGWQASSLQTVRLHQTSSHGWHPISISQYLWKT